MSADLEHYYDLYYRLENIPVQADKDQRAIEAKHAAQRDKYAREEQEVRKAHSQASSKIQRDSEQRKTHLQDQMRSISEAARTRGANASAPGRSGTPTWPDFQKLQYAIKQLDQTVAFKKQAEAEVARLSLELNKKNSKQKAIRTDIFALLTGVVGIIATVIGLFFAPGLAHLLLVVVAGIINLLLYQRPSYVLNKLTARSAPARSRGKAAGYARVLSAGYLLLAVSVVAGIQTGEVLGVWFNVFGVIDLILIFGVIMLVTGILKIRRS